MSSAIRRWAVRLFRAIAIVIAAALISVSYGPAPSESGFTLTDVREFFPAGARLASGENRTVAVYDSAGSLLGAALKTAPETDDLIGYSGPSDLLIGLDPAGRIIGVRLLASDDTPAHVNDVRNHSNFWHAFRGWLPAEEKSPVEAVSGSTLTSLAMAEGVQRRLTGKHLSLRFPEPVTLDEARSCFPAAASLQNNDPRPSWTRVLDAEQQTLGYLLRSSPQSDNLIGYKGPTETLLAIAADRKTIVALKLRRSYDTEEYVDRVREDDAYLALPKSKTLDEWAKIDFKAAGIEGVSGATMTSFAVVEGARRRAAAEFEPKPQVAESDERWRRDLGVFTVLVGGFVMCFTRLRGSPRARMIWRWCLILMLGLWFGDLLSLALFAGWARHGVPWRTAPGLSALAAAALLVPWTTKRQIYCHQLCPHGAAQEVLGRFRRLHVSLPAGVSRTLGWAPYVLLAVAFFLAIAAAAFDLSTLEPFDAWVLRRGAIASSILAVVGLIASLFVPQAYCRFGCPTGALLKLIRTHGRADGFSWQEGLVAILLLAGGAGVWAGRPARVETTRLNADQLRGEAFGTTWSVKFRSPPANAEQLRTQITAELERIESSLSSWRPTSETSQFNASQTTLALEFSPELIALVEHGCKLGAATDGAFDLTVAPLVNAWGFGPAGEKEPPTDEDLQAILPRVGWDKLVVDVESNTLQKKHPELTLDLGALLQGYAADRIAALLTEDALIEVGGELRARGAWTVAIENPGQPNRALRTFELRDAALATSGVYRRGPNGEPSTRHILSPQTGRPVETGRQLVAVVRPTCLEADGWATALLATEDAVAIAEREQLSVFWFTEDGVEHERQFPRPPNQAAANPPATAPQNRTLSNAPPNTKIPTTKNSNPMPNTK